MNEIAAYLGVHWVDVTSVVFLLSFVLSGISNGFIINLIDLFGFLFSFAAGLQLYPVVAAYLTREFGFPLGISKGMGFILMGFAFETIFFVIARIFYRYIPESVKLSRVNKLTGPIPAIVNGLVVLAFFLSISISLPIHPQIKQTILKSSSGNILVGATYDIEKEVAAIFGEALQDTLSFITIEPSSSELVDLKFKTTEVTVDEVSERVMFELVNSERAKAGVGRLTMDEEIGKVARAHGKEMFAGGFFSHITTAGVSPFDRMSAGGVEFLSAGENLAYAPTVELAHKGLMQSPGHRENILSPDYGRVGIGVIDGGVYGKMFVQNFADSGH